MARVYCMTRIVLGELGEDEDGGLTVSPTALLASQAMLGTLASFVHSALTYICSTHHIKIEMYGCGYCFQSFTVVFSFKCFFDPFFYKQLN